MLVFVFLVAILNLAVGYALGSGAGLSSVLALVPSRRGEAPPTDLEDEEQLTRPAKQAKKTAKPAETAEENLSEEAPPKKKKKAPTKADVLASLATMRNQMTEAGVELKGNQADPEKFEQSANKLQEANHAYLEEAEGTIKQLDELGAAGDAEASASRNAVAEGTTRIAAMSNEIDGMIESGLDSDEARARVVAKADEIDAAAGTIEGAVGKPSETSAAKETPAARPPAAPITELSDSMKSIDDLFNRLQAVLEASGPEVVQHVAALRVDPIANYEGDEALIESLEAEVALLAGTMIEESQSYVAGHPSMLLLEGDSFEEASERLERLRQQVEATTFDREGSPIKATITCAVTDATAKISRDQLVEQLNQSLEESARLGANRTFHHDGAFPTPLPELSITLEPRTIEIG